MRKWNIAMWLGGATLLCAIASCSALARAQSIGSQQVADAEVGASVSAVVSSDIRAGTESGISGSANYSSGGRGSAATALPGALPSHGSRGAAYVLKTRGVAVKVGKENEIRGVKHLTGLNRYRAAHAPKATEEAMASTRLKSALASPKPGAIRSAVSERATYSDGFQDSTKGTALISPPDPGTSGPFVFSPGLNTELPDFSDRQFLSPGLHGGGGSRANKTHRRSVRNPALASGSDLASDPMADLGTSISTSVSQQ